MEVSKELSASFFRVEEATSTINEGYAVLPKYRYFVPLDTMS
jgi:hypothetical protein